jgi:hypothetical protein
MQLRPRWTVPTLLLVTFGACNSVDGGATRSQTWSVVSVPAKDGFTIVRGSGSTDTWMAAADSIWRWDGQNWNAFPGPNGGGARGLWVNTPNDVWVGLGQKFAYHWTSGGWTSVSLGDNRTAMALWGSGSSDVWTSDCGAGYLGHYDGTGWTHLGSIDNGRAIWGTNSGDVWMIEGNCIPSSSGPSSLIHWNGISGGYIAGKQTQFMSARTLQAIWGSGTSDIWAVGDSGTIVHYDGRAWAPLIQSPVTVTLHGVWGTAANDVWAVGDSGVILHFDASGWSKAASPTTRTLRSVWGDPSGGVWAVGDTGTVLHLAH